MLLSINYIYVLNNSDLKTRKDIFKITALTIFCITSIFIIVLLIFYYVYNATDDAERNFFNNTLN